MGEIRPFGKRSEPPNVANTIIHKPCPFCGTISPREYNVDGQVLVQCANQFCGAAAPIYSWNNRTAPKVLG